MIYIFNVFSMRKVILNNVCVKGKNEAGARANLYAYLCEKNLINYNLFYKLELLKIVNVNEAQ